VDDDDEHVDLVSKAEREFYECIESEKNRRDREQQQQQQTGDDEKHDRGKVRARSPQCYMPAA